MEPYEILEELNKTTFQSPFTELKTLSDLVAELRTYWAESQNSKRAWYLVDLWDNLLLSKLHIGLFVAAKDGKPLEVPYHYDRFEQYGLSMPFNTSESQICFEYQKAQQEVIFEGWEVVSQDESYSYLYNEKNNAALEFDHIDDTVAICFNPSFSNDEYEYIKSIADLAEAAQSNPLKLK
jgi:hypothetical protein